MDLKESYMGKTVRYLMDAGDGQFVESEMPAEVAAEIVARTGGRKSKNAEYPVKAGDYLFPAEPFEDGGSKATTKRADKSDTKGTSGDEA